MARSFLVLEQQKPYDNCTVCFVNVDIRCLYPFDLYHEAGVVYCKEIQSIVGM